MEGLVQVQKGGTKAGRPEGRRYKGTANCRSLVGCGLCRDDSSGRGGAGILVYGGAIKTPRKPFHYSNLKISNRR